MEGKDPERYKVGDLSYAPASLPKVQIAVDPNDSTESCATFVLKDEDHTLGNSVRWVLLKDPRVEFAGYTAPHPSEKKINIRIQTDGTISATEAFREALVRLQSLADVIAAEFRQQVTNHRNENSLELPPYDAPVLDEEEDANEGDNAGNPEPMES